MCRKFLLLTLIFGLAAGIIVGPAPTADAQTSAPSGVRISQIYTRGGEPGAAYRNDFIEIFNGGSAPVDVMQWELRLTSINGSVTTAANVALFSLGGSLTLQPGRYLLIKFNGGPEGQPLPTPDVDLGFVGGFLNLGDAGSVALMRRGAPQIPAFVCPQFPVEGVEDFVGYGAVGCFEGERAAPAPTLTTAAKRLGEGCVDTDNNGPDFVSAPAFPRNTGAPPASCDAPADGVFNFGAPQFNATEDSRVVQIPVARSGDLSRPATVDYATADGTANERRDYTTALGTLHFAPGEQAKSFDVLLTADAFVEGQETVTLTLSNPTGGAALGLRSSVALNLNDGPVVSPEPNANPSDNTTNFVRQHYHDFLNREPDQAGLDFWSQGIEGCATPECVRVQRVDASAAFFLSIEFQETGYFVYRLYKAALPERAERPRALPRYREFVRDTQAVGRDVVVGQGEWAARLAANRRAFLEAFVARPEFQENYPPSLTPEQYVQKLNLQAGSVLSLEEAAALIGGLFGGTETRASVLGRVADDPDFVAREKNRAFVLMQYFGYLRRNPDDVGFDGLPDPNFVGYDFWLGKLEENHGDFRAAEMVRSFLESIEYRQRFGQ